MNSYKIKEEKVQTSALKSSKISFRESLMGACTNIVYKLGAIGGIKRVPHLLTKNNQQNGMNVILGQFYPSREEAKKKLKTVIWFTYREKLKIAEDLNSDVGWGCLPRVGQMLMAQALLSCLSKEKQTPIMKEKVIESFLDEEGNQCKYSLNKILKTARIKFSITPGEWFHIGQISQVLRKLQDSSPLEGTQRMKVLFFNQAAIFVADILKKGGIKRCMCKQQSEQNCIYHQLVRRNSKIQQDEGTLIIPLPERLSEIEQQQAEQQFQLHYQNEKNGQNPLKNQVLMIVSIRVGSKEIQVDEYQALKELLNMRISLGIIGGVPKKALYIVGHSNNQFVYLDPHYVQDHVNHQNLKQNLHTFYCEEFRTLNYQTIDPSMALAFYLRSIEDIMELIEKISTLKRSFQRKDKSFFVSVLDSNDFEEELDMLKSMDGSYECSKEYHSFQFRDLAESP